MVVPSEQWIVTDEDGQVLGRLKSPYYSSAVYFAERWWPDSQPVVWRWEDASRHQREQAAGMHLMDTEKNLYLIDWAQRLQDKFERTSGRVQ